MLDFLCEREFWRDSSLVTAGVLMGVASTQLIGYLIDYLTDRNENCIDWIPVNEPSQSVQLSHCMSCTGCHPVASMIREETGRIPNPTEKNALFVFHGRTHGFPRTSPQDLDFENYNIFTVDKSPAVNTDILGDVAEADTFRKIADASFDLIIVYTCDCCTGETFRTRIDEVFDNLKRVMKPDARLFVCNWESISKTRMSAEDICRQGFTRVEANPCSQFLEFNVPQKATKSIPVKETDTPS